MEVRRHEGITTYDLVVLTMAEKMTIIRALYQAFRDYDDKDAERLRVALLGGAYPS